jgi:hypothetical protein
MWSKFEPVRSYLYTLVVPVLAVLVYFGAVQNDAVQLWVSVAAAVLGLTGTEIARARVTPTVRLNRTQAPARDE